LNPHSRCRKKDFKSFASADFATRAGCNFIIVKRRNSDYVFTPEARNPPSTAMDWPVM
jgi:hypothetical protein